MPMKINSSGKMQNYDPLTGKYTKANIIEAIEAVDFLSTIKKDIRENSRIDHIIRGDFTETNKYISGGHGQDNIDYMNQNGILFTIDFEYNNGVRIGTIHNRKHYINRKHIHTWFPKDWNKEKIMEKRKIENTLSLSTKVFLLQSFLMRDKKYRLLFRVLNNKGVLHMIIEEMKELINERKKYKENEEEWIEEIWEKEIEVLEKSLDDTIYFLTNADQELIGWSTEVWEDIAAFYKSWKLIDVMKKLKNKFPKIEESITLNTYCSILETTGKMSAINSIIDNMKEAKSQKDVDKLNEELFEIITKSEDCASAFIRVITNGLIYTCELWPRLSRYFKSKAIVEQMEITASQFPNIEKKTKVMLEETKKAF